MTQCLLALGSNLGDRRAILSAAVSAISALPDSQVLEVSRWYETAPVGGPDGQGAFLNGALLLETNVAPHQLCEKLLDIEAKLGRHRETRWDARVIDIDILLYGKQIIDSSQLVVPHPRMVSRRFVLEPAVEIAPEMLHPVSSWSLSQLLSHLQSAPRYVALSAADPATTAWLASCLVDQMGCLQLGSFLPNRIPQGAHESVATIESNQDAVRLLDPDCGRPKQNCAKG